MRWLNSISGSVGMNLSKLQQIVEDRGAWWPRSLRSQRVRHDSSQQQQHGKRYGQEQRTKEEREDMGT